MHTAAAACTPSGRQLHCKKSFKDLLNSALAERQLFAAGMHLLDVEQPVTLIPLLSQACTHIG